MIRKLVLIVILCILIISGDLVFASESSDDDLFGSQIALDILKKVAENRENISFKATETVILWQESGTSACISNIVRKAPNLTRIEYLPSPSTSCESRTVISDGEMTWHYEPSLEVVFYTQNIEDKPESSDRQLDFTKDMDLIKSNYKASLITTEHLAGRETYVIRLEPYHLGNPSRKIWVDIEYPFILRTEKCDSNGVLTSVSFYNQIEFSPELEDDIFQLDIPSNIEKIKLPASDRLMSLEDLKEKANFPIPLPKFLPPGYIIEGGVLSAYQAFPLAHIRLTDGLNTISYFVMPRISKNQQPTNNELSVQQFSSGAKVLKWTRKNYEFTLVSEVHESLLVKMAETIDVPLYKPENQSQQLFTD